jgi:hypothetical protein
MNFSEIKRNKYDCSQCKLLPLTRISERTILALVYISDSSRHFYINYRMFIILRSAIFGTGLVLDNNVVVSLS